MKRNYDEKCVSSFIKGVTHLTGISENKLKKYASENNLFNVLEHPHTIDPNKQQLEKIYLLNEFISMYRLLKLQERENKLSFGSSQIAGEYFMALLGGIKEREKFLATFLDNGNNIIESRIFFEGSVNEVVVYPRAILQAALACDCRSIIFAHNHPGESTEPSKEDRDMTQKLISIFTPLGIKVLDHIIVAGTTYLSMMEKGILPEASSDVSYNAVYLDDRKASEVNETDLGVDISSYSELPDDENQQDDDEWEL